MNMQDVAKQYEDQLKAQNVSARQEHEQLNHALLEEFRKSIVVWLGDAITWIEFDGDATIEHAQGHQKFACMQKFHFGCIHGDISIIGNQYSNTRIEWQNGEFDLGWLYYGETDKERDHFEWSLPYEKAVGAKPLPETILSKIAYTLSACEPIKQKMMIDEREKEIADWKTLIGNPERYSNISHLQKKFEMACERYPENSDEFRVIYDKTFNTIQRGLEEKRFTEVQEVAKQTEIEQARQELERLADSLWEHPFDVFKVFYGVLGFDEEDGSTQVEDRYFYSFMDAPLPEIMTAWSDKAKPGYWDTFQDGESGHFFKPAQITGIEIVSVASKDKCPADCKRGVYLYDAEASQLHKSPIYIWAQVPAMILLSYTDRAWVERYEVSEIPGMEN